MSAAPPAARDPQDGLTGPAGFKASRPLWLSLVIVALVTAVRLTGTVDSDVAWQLWIAGRIHAGAHLYRDIIETNPPLWFWMALPIDRIATFLHVPVDAVLIIAMGALAALSLAATNRLLPALAPAHRALLLGYAALVEMAMPWMHVGQREQIALIGAVPYAALSAARRNGRTVPVWLAALVGIGAGLGFALKHYFLIVPALLELWLLAAQAQRWRPFRAEIFAMVGVGALYAAAILLLAPDFLTAIVPLIRLAYGVTGAASAQQLFGLGALTTIVTLALLLSQYRLLADRSEGFAAALAIAATGFAAAYFIQAKGWPYHAIPMLGCASLALMALIAEAKAIPSLLRIGAPAVLLLPFALAFQEWRNEWLPSADLKHAVAGLQPHESIAFLTTDTAIPWSITLQRGFRYVQRYNGYWMLIAVVANERRGNDDPRLAALGRRVVSETVADFRCTPPQRIVVARPRPGEQGFDILPFFLRDPRFAALLSNYRVRERTSFETYELASPVSAAPPRSCRRGV